MVKTCTKCKEIKPVTAFHKRRDIPNGYQSWCKSCRNEREQSRRDIKRQYDKIYRTENAQRIKENQRRYYAENFERLSDRKKRYKNQRKEYFNALDRERSLNIAARAKKIWNSARRDGPKRGHSFNICYEQILGMLMKETCAVSGIKFDLKPSKERVNPFAPSLDRIDNDRGYEPDNVQLVCNMFNLGKSDCSQIDFISMCVMIAKRHCDDDQIKRRVEELTNA